MSFGADVEDVRIDKWLWAARMFKHRSVATRACAAGHVKLNDQSVKASRKIRVGDRVEVRTPGGLRVLVVVGLSERRGPARDAVQLYEDHSPPPEPRGPWDQVIRESGTGRPTKRARRQMERMRSRNRK